MYSPARWFQFKLTKAILLCITHSSLRGTYSAHTMFFYWAHLFKLLQLLTNISYIVTCIKVGKAGIVLTNPFYGSLVWGKNKTICTENLPSAFRF